MVEWEGRKILFACRAVGLVTDLVSFFLLRLLQCFFNRFGKHIVFYAILLCQHSKDGGLCGLCPFDFIETFVHYGFQTIDSFMNEVPNFVYTLIGSFIDFSDCVSCKEHGDFS